jgi:hypothetical protein
VISLNASALEISDDNIKKNWRIFLGIYQCFGWEHRGDTQSRFPHAIICWCHGGDQQDALYDVPIHGPLCSGTSKFDNKPYCKLGTYLLLSSQLSSKFFEFRGAFRGANVGAQVGFSHLTFVCFGNMHCSCIWSDLEQSSQWASTFDDRARPVPCIAHASFKGNLKLLLPAQSGWQCTSTTTRCACIIFGRKPIGPWFWVGHQGSV